MSDKNPPCHLSTNELLNVPRTEDGAEATEVLLAPGAFGEIRRRLTELEKALAEAQQARERAEQRVASLIIAVTGVILREGRALVVKRAEHETAFPGLWAFPGGKVERDESAEAALAREVAEEVGLRVRGRGRFLGIFKFTRPDLRPVVGVRFSCIADGDVTISADFTDYRWVTPEEFADLPHIPGIEQDLYLALDAEAERDTLLGLLREARGRLRCQWAIPVDDCRCENCSLRERITAALPKETQ